MKKYIFTRFLAMSMAVSGLFSCGIDIDEMKETDPESGAELRLTASPSEALVLREKVAEETALALTWTTGSNFGTGNAIEYTVEIDKADGDWTSSYSFSLGRRVYALDIKVSELNDILSDSFGADPDQPADYKARVVAEVTDYPEMTQSSEISFTATTYMPAPDALYIIGDCTEGGWDPAQAVSMTRISGGIFTYEAVVEQGQKFRFITTPGSDWPAYVKAGDGTYDIEYAETAPSDVQDIDFTVTEKSRYMITVDLLDLTVTIEDLLDTPLYMIGSATPGGWDLNEKTVMTETGKGQFSWKGTLIAAGDGFKFITGSDWWPGYVKANDDPSDMSLKYYPSEPDGADDRKFEVSEAGEYEISVDLMSLTVSYEKTGSGVFHTLYIVGDAVSGSWQVEKASEMTLESDGEYTWTGVMNPGKFRFIVTNTSYAPGYWKANNDPDDMGIRYSDTSLEGQDDISFYIVDAGVYTVKAYTEELRITVSRDGDVPDKPEPFEALWLIGSASEAGWDLDLAERTESVKMNPTADDPYTFIWTGDLNSGELKFSCDLIRDFQGKWYMPETNGKPLTSGSEKIILVDSSSDPTDLKWNVTAGNYTITIDQLSETMTVVMN